MAEEIGTCGEELQARAQSTTQANARSKGDPSFSEECEVFDSVMSFCLPGA